MLRRCSVHLGWTFANREDVVEVSMLLGQVLIGELSCLCCLSLRCCDEGHWHRLRDFFFIVEYLLELRIRFLVLVEAKKLRALAIRVVIKVGKPRLLGAAFIM